MQSKQLMLKGKTALLQRQQAFASAAALHASRGNRRASSLRAPAGHNGNGTGGSADVVRVRFHLPYTTEVGEDLAVVGAGDYLGNWQVDRRLGLDWREGHVWVGELEVPSGVTLEYKYIVTRGDGTVEWAPGNNFILDVVSNAGPGCTMDVHELWTGDGPRNVSISEPEPERSPHSNAPTGAPPTKRLVDSPADLVSSVVGRLQGATERLQRVEWEAAVVGLLSQYPLMSAERIQASLKTVRPASKPEIDPSQLQDLLDQMVRDEKLVSIGGQYRLHASSKFTSGKAPPLPPAATSRPLPSSSSSSRSAAAARSGSSRAGAAGAAAAQPSVQVLVPAVMRLLEAYASMTLDRMLRALSTAGPAEVQGVTGEQLREVLAQLRAEGRVLADADGAYRKGLATPSLSRRAGTPSLSRRPLAGSPAPAQATASPGSPTAARRVSPTSSRPSSSSSSSSPWSPGPAMTAAQLQAFEQRALSLLSNYSGCTVERIHAQLQSTVQFPGTVQDALRLLRSLAGEGRVRDANGVFQYVSTRQSTPTGARGSGSSPAAAPARVPSPARTSSPTPARGGAGAYGALRKSSSSSPSSPSGGGGGGAASTLHPSSSSPAAAGARDGARASPSPSPSRSRGGGNRVVARSMSSMSSGMSSGGSVGEGAPTSNLSAFSLFCSERREAVRSALPRAGNTEVRRVLASEWIQAPDEVRRQYESAAKANRQREDDAGDSCCGADTAAAATTEAAAEAPGGSGWSPLC